MATTFRLDDDGIVVVIGSGAGGGTLASALARQGIDVLCLEAGPRFEPGDLVNNEAEMFAKLTWLDPRIGIGDIPAALPVWNCKAVGGTTLHWTAACPRLHPFEFRAASTHGVLPGTSLVDWPFDYDTLAPYYDRAEDLLGVTGTNGIGMLPGSANFRVMARAARAVGYRDVDTNRMAINSQPRDGRPACLQTGFCGSGCVIGAKWSTLHTEIPRAERTAHFELRPDCMVTRIVTDGAARVTGVRYRDPKGIEREQRARVVCVAGNTTETTRLLLNSRNTRFPNGLANGSDQVGRNYMRHVLSVIVGVMPGKVAMYKGAQVAGIIRDEMKHDPARGFAGGFQYSTVSFTPEYIAQNMLPGRWGESVARLLERYEDMAAVLVVGEDPPEAENRVTLHPEQTDGHGLPVPIVRYRHHTNSLALRDYADATARRMFAALGSIEQFTIHLHGATHNMGVARIGDDPRRSVCNPWGQTHELNNLFISDGSQFPTSGCANPTLTIVALALRQADYLIAESRSGRI